MGTGFGIGYLQYLVPVLAIGVVSAIPTFVVMLGGYGERRGWIAFAVGCAVGLAICLWLWFYTGEEGYTGRFGHRNMALAGLVGAIFGPRIIVGMTNDPKWVPPSRRKRAARPGSDRDEPSSRTDTTSTEQKSSYDQNRDGGRASTADSRWDKYFRRPSARMTPDEAWQVLGLQAGSSADDVRDAHRRLMIKLHPDVGGSNYLASMVNTARDVLLNGS